MSIRKLRAGRVPSVTASQYIGERGSIFWNESTGEFRLSDGQTAGGLPIVLSFATATHAGAIKPGPGFTIDVNGLLGLRAGPAFYLDETDTFRLKAGTSTQIGGVKSGNGIIIASDGTINIDTAGLSFAFGDFYAFTNTGAHDGACLSSVNENQDINLVSNGTGMVNVVGEFHIHKTNMDVEGALAADPVFVVSSSGYLTVNTPNVPSGAPGALNIVGSLDGTYMPVNGAGGMLHITGNPDTGARITIDGWTTSATDPQPPTAIGAGLITLRASRGTPASPLPTKSGDHLGTIAALGKVGNASGYSQGQTGLLFYAAEDYTLNTSVGSYAVLQTVPVGSNVAQISARFDYDGITATNFRGNVTGNVSGNAGTVTNGVYTTGDQTIGGTKTFSSTIFGSITGNAGTVTNGVVTTVSYSDPSWLTISKSKVGLGNVENTALSTSTYYIGTTQNTYGRASGAQTLAGVSVSGNAGTVTNGVYTTDTGTVTNTMLAGSIANNKLSNSTISGVALGSTLNALTVGYGLKLSSGTTYDGSAALTLNKYDAITSSAATGSGNNGWTYSLDLSTANGTVIVDAGGNFSGTVTITGTPIVGKLVRLIIIGGLKGATTVTVNGLTAGNSSNGLTTFTATSGTASSVIVEFISSTTALSGVFMNCSGAK